MNNADFVAFLRLMKNDIEKIVGHGSQQNYGLMSDALKDVYLNLTNLEMMASGLSIGEDEEPIVIDVMNIEEGDEEAK